VIARKFLARPDPPALYVLHPSEAAVEGIPCVPSLGALLEHTGGAPVDLLVIGVRAASAAQLCTDCFARHAAESILIITAGFAETAGLRVRADVLCFK